MSTEKTTLIDGRPVHAGECLALVDALLGREGSWLFEERGAWWITCQCCEGASEHFDPNGGHYRCVSCGGLGAFKIQMP